MSGESAGEEAAPPSVGSRGMPRRALALIVALSVVGMLGIGWLVNSLPMAPTTATQDTLSEQVGLTTVTLIPSPTPLYANQPESFILRVTDVSGAGVTGAQAQCALSMPTMGMTLPSVDAEPAAQPGEYVCGPQALDAGAWSLAITITLPDGTTGHTAFQLNVI